MWGKKNGFDDSNIRWRTIEGIDHAWYHVLNVDLERKQVDTLFKFAAGQKVVLHRHHAAYSTFMIQGELRLYDQAGALTEIRPTGSYVARPAGGEPHMEGGGEIDCIGYFSNRDCGDVIYEILGPDMSTVATLGINEFKAFLDAQEQMAQPQIF